MSAPEKTFPFYCTKVSLVQSEFQTDVKNIGLLILVCLFAGVFVDFCLFVSPRVFKKLTNVDSFGTIFYPD